MEKFKEWTDPAAELPEDAVDRDLLLTNVMLYWLTGTAGSSANSYCEAAHAGAWARVNVPQCRPESRYSPMDVSIRRTVELEHTLVHWSEFSRGGHFAAMEAPTCSSKTSGSSSASYAETTAGADPAANPATLRRV